MTEFIYYHPVDDGLYIMTCSHGYYWTWEVEGTYGTLNSSPETMGFVRICELYG